MYRMPVPISSCSYLGPSYLPKPTRPEICSHPHPVTIKLQHLPSMERRICGGLRRWPSAPCLSPVLSLWPFLQPRKALPSFLPKERHSLRTVTVGTIPALLRHQQTIVWPPVWPPGGPPWKNPEVTALSNQSHPLFQELHPKENWMNAAAWWAGSHWAPSHTSYKGPGKGPDPFGAARKRVEGTGFHHSSASQRRCN